MSTRAAPPRSPNAVTWTAQEAEYEVRLYRQPVPRFWWLRRRSYLLSILRGLGGGFVVWFVAYLLGLLWAVAAGEAAYRRFLELAGHPAVLALNLLALVSVPLQVVRPRWPAALAWLAVSAFLIWLVVAG